MTEQNLSQIYEKRFSGMENYRKAVWKKLIDEFFIKWIPKDGKILDIGCGYGEFINQVNCSEKLAMDLNPKTGELLDSDVIFHEQDCSKPWKIKANSLDLVFTSNFFEHLPNKHTLELTFSNIYKSLKPNGYLIAMGPNIAALHGKYWDFWDHHIALSDQSLCEITTINKLSIEKCIPKFLPYNMVRTRRKPLFLLSIFLRVPFLWKLFGKQFLLIAKKD